MHIFFQWCTKSHLYTYFFLKKYPGCIHGIAPLDEPFLCYETKEELARTGILLFVCLCWQVQVQGQNFFINCWNTNVLFRVCISWHFALLGICGSWLEASSQLGAYFGWERSLGHGHRNQTLPLQLGHFSWLSFSTMGLLLPGNHLLNITCTFVGFFVKPPFCPNFTSQLTRILLWASFVENVYLFFAGSQTCYGGYFMFPVPRRQEGEEFIPFRFHMVFFLFSNSLKK